MAFEFFFGIFGLISSDSKSRHKSRLENEWRLPTPLNANLFRDAGLKSPISRAGGVQFNKSSGGLESAKGPIFSTTGTLAAANSSSAASDALFSSNSSSSASSIASSGSNLTTNSTSAFIKATSGDQSGAKKHEFRLNLIGEKSANNKASSSSLSTNSTSGIGADFEKLTSNVLGGKSIGGGGGLAGNLLSDEQDDQQAGGTISSSATTTSRSQQLRKLYCLIICACLWLHVFRLIVGLLVDKSLVTLDFYYLGAYKIHFLIPAMCLAIQAAAVSTLFIRNNDETNWLVPFYSSKDYLIRSRSNFKPKIEDYTRRVNISVVLALALALVSSVSLSAYLIHCGGQSGIIMPASLSTSTSANQRLVISSTRNGDETTTIASGVAMITNTTTTTSPTLQTAAAAAAAAASNRMERLAIVTLLSMDVLWAIYSTYICFLVSFYFNLICSIMKSRFHGISKIIEDLAESNTTKTTNQARKITTLYLEHNEACELLDESNDFWQYLIFFTYFTYIPAYCYCLYNLFFVDFEAWPSFITWVIHTHTGFIILLISFSAAGVSTEAHAPYTSLHTLSLIQLPLDVEVNIATFLHRVRGLTIGYSCYDLFAITNASMSNTAAACASYFLIVADFSRSSVFTLAQMNGSAAAAAAASSATLGVGGAPTTPTPPH